MRPADVISGTVILDTFEEVVKCRDARLHVPRWYSGYPGAPHTARRRAEMAEWGNELRSWLDESGVAQVELDGQLTAGQLIALASGLGDPQPETSSEVAQFVDEGVVLNLSPALKWSADRAYEPFSWSAVRLHSEGSVRPPSQQPRYIIFQCVEPGSPTTGDQTILVSMADVHQRLSDEQREILASVRLGHREDAAPLLQASSPVFCFRDFGADEIRWTCSKAGVSPGQVVQSMVDLVIAMYTVPCFGVHWTRHALVTIDNKRFFHGRTRGVGVHRHLRRIRVGQRPGPPGGSS
jgi:alpha-ketoglutarate-dependent taurine dioxygenase